MIAYYSENDDSSNENEVESTTLRGNEQGRGHWPITRIEIESVCGRNWRFGTTKWKLQKVVKCSIPIGEHPISQHCKDYSCL